MYRDLSGKTFNSSLEAYAGTELDKTFLGRQSRQGISFA